MTGLQDRHAFRDQDPSSARAISRGRSGQAPFVLVERLQVGVASDDHLGPTSDGGFQHAVVVTITGPGHPTDRDHNDARASDQSSYLGGG